jgi:hypothetical protein
LRPGIARRSPGCKNGKWLAVLPLTIHYLPLTVF